MPKPDPSKETQKEYIERCMAYPDLQDLDEDARYAKCIGMWEQATKAEKGFTPPDAGDAPQGVKDILSSAYSSCRSDWVKDHPDDKENKNNKSHCAQVAWTAVKNAGWHQTGGKWKKTKKSITNSLSVVIKNIEVIIKQLEVQKKRSDILKEIPDEFISVFEPEGQEKFKSIYFENRYHGNTEKESLDLTVRLIARAYKSQSLQVLKNIENTLTAIKSRVH